MDNPEVITTLEWCAGYGGIGLGLKAVYGDRVRCLAYSDVEGFVQANLVSKMEAGLMDEAPIWPNLKSFPNKYFHGLVDIFVAGYPCQPFSHAGKRRGNKDPRHLWPFIKRAVRIIRPRCCFFENVSGHLTLGFKDVCHDLDELGYTVTAGLFTAAEVGAPHNRKRLFIMAHNNDFGLSHGKLALDATEAGLDAQRDLAPGRAAALADTEDADRRPGERGAQAGARPDGVGRRGPSIGSAEMADARRDGRDGRGLPDGSEEWHLPESAQREGEGAILRREVEGRRETGHRGEAVAHPDDARAARLGEHGGTDGSAAETGLWTGPSRCGGEDRTGNREQGTGNREHSLWPTSTSRDWKDTPGMTAQRDGKDRVDQLPRAVYQEERSGPQGPDKNNMDGNLPESWATPRSGKTTDENPETWKKRQEKGDVSTMPLGAQAKAWATPRSAMDSGPHGKRIDTLHSQMKDERWLVLTEEEKRKNPLSGAKLNPRWVETLMGLPMGWTDPNFPASTIKNWKKFTAAWSAVQTEPTSYGFAETGSSPLPPPLPGELFTLNLQEEEDEDYGD